MKVSLKWMRRLAGDQVDFLFAQNDLIEKIGAQLGAVESVTNLADIYAQARVVKVQSCAPLEGSDHLKVCKIDDKQTTPEADRDKDGLIQVVCGAPNVAAGQLVVWLPPGSIVPETTDKEPFVLSVRPIMDVKSNGMIASARELALNDDHEGIVVLPAGSGYGQLLLEVLDLDDTVIEIENKMFTHRPDLFGQLGIARELCGIYERQFTSPAWYKEQVEITAGDKVKLSVSNELVDAGCPRFMAVAIGAIANGPSPLWLQSLLMRTGIRPVSLIVDVTNFVMMATGQPLHAYDLSKVGSETEALFKVRLANEKEELELLDGTELKLLPTDIVIASQTEALGLGGVMGGRSSAIDEATTTVVFECASFDMYSIRRTSMAHGIFSEAVTRFNKGQSPRQCPAVLAYAVQLLKDICPSASVVSNLADSGPSKANASVPVVLKETLIDSYLGVSLGLEASAAHLNNVELQSHHEGETLTVTPPFWRTDISEAVDVVEEIARLKGFSSLPLVLPERSISPSHPASLTELKAKIRQGLSAAGANEVLSYSFVNKRLLADSGQDPELSFKIANSLSPELQYYRQSLTPSLLSKVHLNHKAGYPDFVLFELGKGHLVTLKDDKGIPSSVELLALTISADDKTATAYDDPAFYHARAYLDYLLGYLQIPEADLEIRLPNQIQTDWLKQASKPYLPERSGVVLIKGKPAGIIGEYKAQTSSALKLPGYCAGFELELELLSNSIDSVSHYVSLSRYPMVVQDLTLETEKDALYADIYQALSAKLAKTVASDLRASLVPIDGFRRSDGGVNWTFRVSVQSYTRTLTDQEVARLVESLKEADS